MVERKEREETGRMAKKKNTKQSGAQVVMHANISNAMSCGERWTDGVRGVGSLERAVWPDLVAEVK